MTPVNNSNLKPGNLIKYNILGVEWNLVDAATELRPSHLLFNEHLFTMIGIFRGVIELKSIAENGDYEEIVHVHSPSGMPLATIRVLMQPGKFGNMKDLMTWTKN